MGSALYLEFFDDGAVSPKETDQSSLSDTSFEDGYTAGLAAAEESFAADQATLKAQMIDVLRDAQMGYEHALADLLETLRPLHDALIAAILPELLAPALYLRLRELLGEACKADMAAPLTVFAPPGQAAVLQHMIAESDLSNVTVAIDNQLGPNSARVASTHGETSLDLDAALAAIATQMDMLASLIDSSGKATTHG